MEAEEEEREVDFVVGVYPAKEISLKREGKGYKMVHIAFLYHRLLGRPLAGTFFFGLSLSLFFLSPPFFLPRKTTTSSILHFMKIHLIFLFGIKIVTKECYQPNFIYNMSDIRGFCFCIGNLDIFSSSALHSEISNRYKNKKI